MKPTKSKKDQISNRRSRAYNIDTQIQSTTKKNSNRVPEHETGVSSYMADSQSEESFSVNTTWVREWLLLETSPSNTGACLNCALFDLDNMSLDSSQMNIDASQPITSMSTSRGMPSQGAFSSNMANNLSSFFNSFKIYPKALEVDLQIKRKYLKKYCTTLSHFLNDQGITSGFIEFPNDIIEDNGHQLVKLLEFFGEGLNIPSVKKDNLFEVPVDSIAETKPQNYKSKSKQNSFNMIPDLKPLNKKVKTVIVVAQ